MSVELSVVIPTYQRRESLRQVLAALCRQTLPLDAFEVIVSVDGSRDGTEQMLAALDVPYELRWVASAHGGPGAARNLGAQGVQGRFLLFLDDDILSTPQLLASHLACHRGNGERTVCLGQVRTPPVQPLSPWEQYLCARLEEQYDKLGRAGYRPDFWDCLSANFSLGRVLWDESGGFDRVFRVARHEDVELGYRLQQLGAHFVYRPLALGYHRFLKSPSEGLRDARSDGCSAVRLARRHPQLAPHLFGRRWRRYPPHFRSLLQWSLNRPQQHRRLAARSEVLLQWSQRLPVPPILSRAICRLAFHLHFWLGVQMELQDEELARSLSPWLEGRRDS